MYLHIQKNRWFLATKKNLATPSRKNAKKGKQNNLTYQRCNWSWKHNGQHTVLTSCPNRYAKVKVVRGDY